MEWDALETEAVALDRQKPGFRDAFEFPTALHPQVTYLCGNSLGLMPKRARESVKAELDTWASRGVEGHMSRTDGREPWVHNDDLVSERLAKLVFGCRPSEVCLTGTLTTNLNALLQTFYRPQGRRNKLLCESKAFPSDAYSFQNQARLRGLDPADAILEAVPRSGELCLRTEDILGLIKAHGDEIAVVCLSAVQFYTGQCFDIPTITRAAHEHGCIVGWDLAHAAGNIELYLHDWDVDFAVFCSYKYLNCGPGNMGGLFIHDTISERYRNEPRAAGWWGVDPSVRFEMRPQFESAPGARGFCQSNLNFLGPPLMHASLDIFEQAGGVHGVQSRRQSLVSLLLRILRQLPSYGPDKEFVVMTDELPESDRKFQQGAQVSLLFLVPGRMSKVFKALEAEGVIGDKREPAVIRLAPAPLYNTHMDVVRAVKTLDKILTHEITS